MSQFESNRLELGEDVALALEIETRKFLIAQQASKVIVSGEVAVDADNLVNA